MPSKWAKFKGKLDKLELAPSYQSIVDERKKVYVGLLPADLGRRLKLVDDAKDTYEAEIKECNLEMEALSQLIVSAMENYDLNSLELESGMKVSLDIKPYVSVIDTYEARDAYDKWIHSPSMRKLLTLNAQKRDSFVKEQLEAGKPTPSWAKVYLKTRAKLLGKRKEGGGDEE